MITLSSMASRKKRVISHRIWAERHRVSWGKAPLSQTSLSLSNRNRVQRVHHSLHQAGLPHCTLSAMVAASEALTVIETTALAMPTRATTNTCRAREESVVSEPTRPHFCSIHSRRRGFN